MSSSTNSTHARGPASSLALLSGERLERRLAELLDQDRFAPPAHFVAAERVDDASLHARAKRDPVAFWAEKARAAALGPAVHQRAGRLQPAVLPVVRRRQDQRFVQLPRPSRRGRPRRPGGVPLARRGGRASATVTYADLPATSSASRTGSDARRRQGRRRRDLPADDPRGGRGDARLRPDRRRRTTSSSAASRRRRSGSGWRSPGQGADHRRRRAAQGQDGGGQGRGRRAMGDLERSARRRGAPHRRGRARCGDGRDVWYHELLAAADPVCPPEPMDAEHPLFILYSSGSTAKPKGILHTTGGYLPGVALHPPQRLRPRPGDRRLLVLGRRRLDHRALVHRLRAAVRTAY